MKKILIAIITVVFFSCGNDPVPKPKAFLRLEYPEANYDKALTDLPFTFEKNILATKISSNQIESDTESYGVTLEYPALKGTIFLTYKTITTHENLIAFLKDAQNFTQKHTIKADEIIEQIYENDIRKVYGMFYEVGGNAASQSQFYVTDSVKHFLTGSLYFYAKPNYDSILPAANYLQKDIKHIMETVEWK
ncbi:gliding motility lipoprotein GldD [Yeosuana sp. MJ-SS3]|uniref:Gliding motility lipoprotein GldD n=1 Tax=Gilvirhabdus luticola TaxID=3079858 RepID=A0ABU3U3E6_9FLAO|nr:gliding motility lipoprotein GldD [Yeosuana sp. MJ-SS3]MDU8884929.1 gliding motility lipoprotein GldD [Yeosuana sp. MJ-SS3]